MEEFTGKQKRDLKVLIDFVRVYCHARHKEQEQVSRDVTGIGGPGILLCAECAALVAHAMLKRRSCPLEPKPSCKHCHIHCYSREYRARIREIMGFSGRKMILRGRLDYLWHYFF